LRRPRTTVFCCGFSFARSIAGTIHACSDKKPPVGALSDRQAKRRPAIQRKPETGPLWNLRGFRGPCFPKREMNFNRAPSTSAFEWMVHCHFYRSWLFAAFVFIPPRPSSSTAFFLIPPRLSWILAIPGLRAGMSQEISCALIIVTVHSVPSIHWLWFAMKKLWVKDKQFVSWQLFQIEASGKHTYILIRVSP